MRNLFAFFHAPVEHREYVRTTNPIERTFREVRRWLNGRGSLANADACDRLFYKVSMMLNERWETRDLWADPRRRARSRQTAHPDLTPEDLEIAARLRSSVDTRVFDAI